MSTTSEPAMHIGRKIERIRILRGIKQDVLASALGVSQQAVSKLEKSEMIEDDRLEKIADALNVSVEAIKHFDEEAAINFINTFNDNSINNGADFNYKCTINPIEKWVETLEENKKLYERLLQSEREKITLLESLLKK